MDRILLLWKYGAYLPTLPFSCCSGVFFLTDQETDITGQLLASGLGPGGMELARSDGSLNSCEIDSEGQFVGVSGSTTGSSSFLGRASWPLLVKRSICVLLEVTRTWNVSLLEELLQLVFNNDVFLMRKKNFR